jgi:4-hydroxy-tetrahydrodipicolinate synthase
MHRRDAAKTIGAGLLSAGLVNAPQASATPNAAGAPVACSDRKTWAREHFRGMEAFILPSFTPDMQSLDEDGIRNDVRHGISQGFVALYASPLGLQASERRRFVEILAEEGRDHVIVGAGAIGETLEAKLAELRHAEAQGVSETLIGLNTSLQTEEEIYQDARALIEATPLGVLLYGLPRPEFRRFHPTGLPLSVIDRLVDLPNVIGMKLTQTMHPVTMFQLAETVRDRITLGPVNLDLALLLANRHPVRWSGEWAVDSIQSPQRPYAVEFMDLVGRRRLDDAARVYWAMQPALETFYNLQGPTLLAGGHPWVHIKYYKWLTGGNGGLLRDQQRRPDQVPPLDAAGRRACREAFARAGIPCLDLPEDAFIVGNAAYAKGVRPSDMESSPLYVA